MWQNKISNLGRGLTHAARNNNLLLWMNPHDMGGAVLRGFILCLFCTIGFQQNGLSQIDEGQLGSWYMYFFDAVGENGKWGAQGDIQHRNWNLGGDLEQLLLRGGVTYRIRDKKLKLTLGYGNISTGAFGSDDSTTGESRIYQEALFPSRLGGRIFVNHRIRLEQRFVENQDFRTRLRYNLFVNIPINQPEMAKGVVYLAFYNELFLNGENDIGDNRSVSFFDRNRTYLAMGYILTDRLKVQTGVMHQVTKNWNKSQLQLSLHQSF